LGGVAWDYLAYVDRFRRLGCDVLYLEDTGQWLYDPVRQTFTDDVRANVRYLLEALRTIDVADGGFSLRTPDGIFLVQERVVRLESEFVLESQKVVSRFVWK
jgi:hypothetical protein